MLPPTAVVGEFNQNQSSAAYSFSIRPRGRGTATLSRTRSLFNGSGGANRGLVQVCQTDGAQVLEYVNDTAGKSSYLDITGYWDDLEK